MMNELRSHEIDIKTNRSSILFSWQGHSMKITKKLISIGRLYWLLKVYKLTMGRPGMPRGLVT